jgi:hypothetical protein
VSAWHGAFEISCDGIVSCRLGPSRSSHDGCHSLNLAGVPCPKFAQRPQTIPIIGLRRHTSEDVCFEPDPILERPTALADNAFIFPARDLFSHDYFVTRTTMGAGSIMVRVNWHGRLVSAPAPAFHLSTFSNRASLVGV